MPVSRSCVSMDSGDPWRFSPAPCGSPVDYAAETPLARSLVGSVFEQGGCELAPERARPFPHTLQLPVTTGRRRVTLSEARHTTAPTTPMVDLMLHRTLSQSTMRLPSAVRTSGGRGGSSQRGSTLPGSFLLTRLLIDSQQATTSTERGGAAGSRHAGERVRWLPTLARSSFFFAYWPPPATTAAPPPQSRLLRCWAATLAVLRRIISLLVIMHDSGVFPAAERDDGTVYLFEVPFENITGMNFNHPLSSDSQWAIETRLVNRRAFKDEDDLWRYVQRAERVDVARRKRDSAAHWKGAASRLLRPPPPARGLGLLLRATAGEEGSAALRALRLASLPPAQRLNWIPLLAKAEKAQTALTTAEAEPSAITTNMVVVYWSRDSALLPYELNDLLLEPTHARELKIMEAGLPSWCVFLPQRNMWYRRGLRQVVQLISIVWPLFTLFVAFWDLYRSFGFIRDVTHTILAWTQSAGGLVWWPVDLLRRLLWALISPVLNGIWHMLAESLQRVVQSVVSCVAAVAHQAVAAVGEVMTAIAGWPVFEWFVSTKTYFVGILLPYLREVVLAVQNTVRLWGQVAYFVWRLMTGSTMAVWRLIARIGGLPSRLIMVFQTVADAVWIVCSTAGTVLRLVWTPFRWLLSSAGSVAHDADALHAAQRWGMLNMSRQAIAGVVTRLYQLIVWVGCEIAKHWITWVLRPAERLATAVQKNTNYVTVPVASLGLYGTLTFLTCNSHAAVRGPNAGLELQVVQQPLPPPPSPGIWYLLVCPEDDGGVIPTMLHISLFIGCFAVTRLVGPPIFSAAGDGALAVGRLVRDHGRQNWPCVAMLVAGVGAALQLTSAEHPGWWQCVVVCAAHTTTWLGVPKLLIWIFPTVVAVWRSTTGCAQRMRRRCCGRQAPPHRGSAKIRSASSGAPEAAAAAGFTAAAAAVGRSAAHRCRETVEKVTAHRRSQSAPSVPVSTALAGVIQKAGAELSARLQLASPSPRSRMAHPGAPSPASESGSPSRLARLRTLAASIALPPTPPVTPRGAAPGAAPQRGGRA